MLSAPLHAQNEDIATLKARVEKQDTRIDELLEMNKKLVETSNGSSIQATKWFITGVYAGLFLGASGVAAATYIVMKVIQKKQD